MSGIISWKTAKVVVVYGLCVWGVSSMIGYQQAADLNSNAVFGTSYGVGVGVGSAKWAGPGFSAGSDYAANAQPSIKDAKPAPKTTTAPKPTNPLTPDRGKDGD